MRFLVLILIVCCLTGCSKAPTVPSASPPSSVSQTPVDDMDAIQALFQSALHHLRNDNVPAALADLRKAAAIDPNNPDVVEAFLVVALKMRKSGKVQEGLQVVELAVELQPEKAHFWQAKGSFLFAAEKPKEAREALLKARELAPADPNLLYDMGWQGSQSADTHAQALQDYSAAIELDESYQKAWANRGALHNTMGNHQEALADLDQALKLEPEDSVALYEKASALLALGKKKEAKKFARKVVDLNTNPRAVQAAQLLLGQ
jgi:tetratricopeptide (TPR) repeat protein